jgi:hypothetical protein
MSRFTRILGLALLLGSVGSALGACQAIAGIHDRDSSAVGGSAGSGGSGGTAGDSASAGDNSSAGDNASAGDNSSAGAAGGETGPSPKCQDYCTKIGNLCTTPNSAYADITTCLGICRLFPPGEAIEKTGNTLACRLNQLNNQLITGEPSTLADTCANAGPGGAGVCGSNCESYCQLYQAACQEDQPQLEGTPQYDATQCKAACEGLRDTGSFDTDSNYTGDTLQCRLVHTSAATVNPKEHCAHAQLQAQGQAMPAPGPCLDDPKKVKPDCDSFCQLELAECRGDNAVYEDPAQCHAVCEALDKGSITDTSQNTVGCRKYHSYNALAVPGTHCPHTGPGGAGHCGSGAAASTGDTGNCDSYCLLASKACTLTSSPTSNFTTSFPGGQADCLAECVQLSGAGPSLPYSVAPTLPKGNTLQCRLLHVSRALTKPSECPAALGAAPCQ